MSGPRRRALAIAGTLAVVVAVIALYLRPGAPRGASARPAASSAPAAPPASSPVSVRGSGGATRARAALDHQALAPSLAGTDVDGYLAADEDGNLILALGVRDFFDYFLSTVGEVPLEDVLAFMEAYARARLPARAADQLMSLLADYMAYRRAAADLYKAPLAPVSEQTQAYYLETLDRTFRDLYDLRRQHMSEGAVRAFFGLEEEYGQYTLDRMAIGLDDRLSDQEKSALLGELRADLSESLRQSEDEKVAQAERAQAVRGILEADAPLEDKRAAVSRYYAPEQVDRIIAHEQQKLDFRARMDQYLAARAPLMSLGEGEREARLAELRQRYFHSEKELVWARTYEARQEP